MKNKTVSCWSNMIQRCTNPNNPIYKHYGGRGIKVCERWRKFRNFLQDMGEKPDGLSLDRIDNNGDYEPNNCRWATTKQQLYNRNCTIVVKIGNAEHNLDEWSQQTGVAPSLIRARLKKGWNKEDAVSVQAKSREETLQIANIERLKKVKTITICGLTLTLPRWLDLTGISRNTYMRRLGKGYTKAEALFSPTYLGTNRVKKPNKISYA